MIDVGIVGGTGYSGAELLRLLARHPGVRVRVLTSRQEDGQRADALFPQLRGFCELSFSAPDVETLASCQTVFFATPHGAALALAPELIQRGVKVLDLSADFRLTDPAQYARWYQHEHTAPALLKEAVYGGGEPTGEAHANMKAAMAAAGIFRSGAVRAPTIAPNAQELAVIAEAVASAGLSRLRAA